MTEKGCARRHVCLREEPGWSHATFHIRQTSTVLVGRGAREPVMRSGAGGLQEELDVATGEVRLMLELYSFLQCNVNNCRKIANID